VSDSFPSVAQRTSFGPDLFFLTGEIRAGPLRAVRDFLLFLLPPLMIDVPAFKRNCLPEGSSQINPPLRSETEACRPAHFAQRGVMCLNKFLVALFVFLIKEQSSLPSERVRAFPCVGRMRPPRRSHKLQKSYGTPFDLAGRPHPSLFLPFDVS